MTVEEPETFKYIEVYVESCILVVQFVWNKHTRPSSAWQSGRL